MIHVRPIQRHASEIASVATILVAGFADRSLAWPTLADGIAEVEAHSTNNHLSLVATIDHVIVGWVSAAPQYQQYGWELHPLVVNPPHQHQGIGKTLIAALCAQLTEHGATTLFAWSDDESLSTSLGGKDLLPNPLAHLTTFSASERHAGGFYLKQGFVLCGVLPDANGRGKPDILFARRIS
ncbi:MAG: GNAT family N-acetyltransferase [Roseiflexaceae bacterium]